MIKARLYARASTDEQKKKDLSVPAQVSKLEQYCIDNKIKVMGIYKDNGISAATIEKRKDFCKLLDDLKNDEVILFTRLDRFSRNLLDANILLKRFYPMGVTFKAIFEEDIDVTTADGKFIFDLKCSLAERERKKDSERILDVFEHKLAQGTLLSGRLQLGYKSINKRPVIDDEKAEIVKYIYDQYEIINSISMVMEKTNNTFGVKILWQTIYNILKDRRYTGLYRNIPDYWPQIIDIKQFENVQSIVESKSIRRPSTNRIYIFTGILACPYCGKRLSGSSHKWRDFVYKNYRCQTHNKDKRCDNRRVYSEKKLEECVLLALMPSIKQQLKLLRIDEKVLPISRDRISETKAKIKRLQDLYVDGLIEKEHYLTKFETLTILLESEVEKTNIHNIADKKKLYLDFMNMNMEQIYTQLDDVGKRSFWRSIIDHIVINGYDDIEIVLK